MSDLEKAEIIAENLRREPYVLFRNDCIRKSNRLKAACRTMGIQATVVICLGYTRVKMFGRWLLIPVIHGWGEVEGKRIETSRPLGHSGFLGIIPVHIKPLIVIRL
jgi:hypothetical protein